MKEIRRSVRTFLIVINIIVWCIVLVGFITKKGAMKGNQELIESHHELLEKVNSFRNYEDYKKNIPYMETKMTKSVMEAVCPIIPEAMLGEFPKPKVTNMNTTDVKVVTRNKKKLISTFDLSINNQPPFLQQTESIYEKKDKRWVMTSYRIIF